MVLVNGTGADHSDWTTVLVDGIGADHCDGTTVLVDGIGADRCKSTQLVSTLGQVASLAVSLHLVPAPFLSVLAVGTPTTPDDT